MFFHQILVNVFNTTEIDSLITNRKFIHSCIQHIITSLRLGIDLSLDTGIGVGKDADDAGNVLSSCCL